MKETKTSKAINLFKSGQLKDALAIFRTFRLGFTKNEQRTLQIAYEIMYGNSRFYSDIGINTNRTVEESKTIISKKYAI